MPGFLRSVNVAVPRSFLSRGREIPTGIFKEPVPGRVRVGRLTLEGDLQADLRYHGGADKAAYLFPSEHYPHFQDLLGRHLSPGFFGENFTTEGVLEQTTRAGDVLNIGTALFQVTTPRSPCFKLGLKAGSPGFVRTFLESGRLGFYLRVLEEGTVSAGDPIALVRSDPEAPMLADLIGQRSG